MKFPQYKTIIAAAALVLGMTSCLDFEPKQQLAEKNYWERPEDFKLFANNFYGWVRSFTAATEYKSDKPAHSDYYSDLFTNLNERNLYSNGTNAVPAADGNYGSNYSHIRRCNMLLEKAAQYGSPEDIKTYVGEALFFRAYCYFDLLQLYGGAILTERPLEIGDPEMLQTPDSRDKVIEFIINDLKEAALKLPAHAQLKEEGRISSEAANAFLSRVALYEGTWQKFRNNEAQGTQLLDEAVTAARKVMQSGAFQLFKPSTLGDSAQKYMFILENAQCNPAGLTKSSNREYIITRRYDEVLSPINFNVTHTFLRNAVWVSGKFADMYLCQNGLPITVNGAPNPQFQGRAKVDSEWQNRDNRMRYTLMRPHDNFWSNTSPRTKWNGADTKPMYSNFLPTTGTGYHNQKWCVEREVKDKYEGFDFPVLRYAEVLLNYAEAMYERDGSISDADLDMSLNLVRLRVNPDMVRLSNNLVNNNGLSMREEIRRERTIELYCEGFRLDDLKRWKTAEVEMPMDMIGIQWKGTEYEKTWATCPYTNRNAEGRIIIEKDRRWDEKNYLFPLPIDQLQLNPNLNQNPGWK